jgi:hypothetical protein
VNTAMMISYASSLMYYFGLIWNRLIRVYLFILFLENYLLLVMDSDDSDECEQVDVKVKKKNKADADIKTGTNKEA